jgi:hypothetical protein
MRMSMTIAVALGCCATASLAGIRAAPAGQSWLYPYEVRARPVVAVNDPCLQRRYWDPRYDDFYRATALRRRRGKWR